MSQIPVYWFIHKNTIHKLKEYGLMNELKVYKNIRLVDPLNYASFVQVLKNAQFVIIDGGSLQEECAELCVPCCVCRRATEREELLDRPDQTLTKLDPIIASEAIMKYSLPREPYKLYNAYKQSKSASEQIVDVLLEKVRQKPKKETLLNMDRV